MEIVTSEDLAYDGKGYTPTMSQRRVVLHDQAIAQILAFLEGDAEVSKRYTAFLEGVKVEEEKRIAAINAERQARIDAQQALMLKQAKAEVEAESAAMAARKSLIEAQLAALGGKATKAADAVIAEKAAAVVIEETSNAPVVDADVNGDGRVDKSEMIARLKADGIAVDETAHWKVIEKQYKKQYNV